MVCSPLDGDGNDRRAQVAGNLLEESEMCDLCFKATGRQSLSHPGTVWGMQLKQ